MKKTRGKPGGASARALMVLSTAAALAPFTPVDRAFAQEAEPQTSAPASTQASAQSGAEASAQHERRLNIYEYRVEGNTILQPIDIQRAIYPFLGPERAISDVEGARAALEQAYAARGFQTVYVEIPQQSVTRSGILRLRVVEGRVGEVAVAGAEHHSAEQVLQSLPSLREGETPNVTALNRELVALNSRSADLQVTPDIRAGDAPGQIDVTLNVDDQSGWHGALGLNNQYSRDTTELRANASLRYENLWGRGHEIGAFYSTAPENRDDGEVYVLAYAAPIDVWRIDISALKSTSDVGTLADTTVNGEGESLTIALSRPLSEPSERFYQTFQGSLSYKNFNEQLRFGVGTAPDPVPITYYPVNLSWNGMLRGEASDLTLNAGFTFAFRGAGSDVSEFDNKAYQATGGFAYLTLGASYRRNALWGSEIFGSIDGQISNEPLVSNEQFAIGGAGSVRGYLQSEAIGDHGARATIEWRSPDFSSHLFGVFEEMRLYGGLDAGYVSMIDPLPEVVASETLVGAALGLRARLFDHVSGQVELGQALSDSANTEAGETRVHFRLGADF